MATKVRLNAVNYIRPYSICEDIRVDLADDTIVERIPLGEAEWVADSHNWDVTKAAEYVAAFEEFTGTVPTLDWDNYYYKVDGDTIIPIPKP